MTLGWKTLVGAFVLGLAGGVGLEWELWRPTTAPREIAAPEVRQKDASLVLARAPDAHAKPKQLVPAGATVERVVSVTVQPSALLPANVSRETAQPATTIATVGVEVPRRDSGAGPTQVTCPPVRVDLTLLRMQDGTHRVTASSPDGAVIGGVDIPVEAAKPPPRDLRWSAGALYNPAAKTYGGFVTRDLGPLRLIAAASQPSQAAAWSVNVGVALRW